MTEHIKMPDVSPIVRYNADGAQTSFTYPFPIFASEDLAVYVGGAKQSSGYDISGAGSTSGGSVTFDSAPDDGAIVTLARELPLERLTDFLEGGDFSANAINTELDFLIAALQQVSRQNDTMLRYGEHETPASTELPAKALRANKALGFDGSGNPVPVSLDGAVVPTDFTASGTGAITRAAQDKFSDLVSIKDFGALGDGLTDDAGAIQNALAAHDAVLIPSGTFLIKSTISLSAGKALIGLGQGSVIKTSSNAFNALEVPCGYTSIQNLRIEGGAAGIKLHGKDSECVQNVISDVQIIGANTGLVLDGYNDTNKPCYWNTIRSVLVQEPLVHGVYLTLSGAGDTPNANRFYDVRVYSKGAATSGHGFYVEHGALNNSFIDCEANVNGASAQSCFTVGAGSSKTILFNLLTESSNGVPNVVLESGSDDTIIMNLTSQSDGAAIDDNSGGSYSAFNAGWPYKNILRRSVISDLKATLMRYDTEFVEGAGTHSLDLSHSIHIANATMGAMTLELPAASSAESAEITIKKVDDTGNIITITEDGGDGPDGKPLQLGGVNDYVTVISNGSAWYIKSSNRMSGNTRYAETSGTYDIDMAVDTYLLSSYSGAMTARLPPANASESFGRTITLKKIDVSSNNITVTEQGGVGPDNYAQVLSDQYDAITVVSNGSAWYVVSRYS